MARAKNAAHTDAAPKMISSMSIPCFDCGTDMIHDYGWDICPECGAVEAASLHDHGTIIGAWDRYDEEAYA